jgi:hypothetical protein
MNWQDYIVVNSDVCHGKEFPCGILHQLSREWFYLPSEGLTRAYLCRGGGGEVEWRLSHGKIKAPA